MEYLMSRVVRVMAHFNRHSDATTFAIYIAGYTPDEDEWKYNWFRQSNVGRKLRVLAGMQNVVLVPGLPGRSGVFHDNAEPWHKFGALHRIYDEEKTRREQVNHRLRERKKKE